MLKNIFEQFVYAENTECVKIYRVLGNITCVYRNKDTGISMIATINTRFEYKQKDLQELIHADVLKILNISVF